MNPNKIFRSLCLLSLLCFAGIGHAAPGSADAYLVDMTLSLNGSLIGKPALVAEAGAEAEVRDENPMKLDHGFRILLTASPLDATQNGKESIKLQLEFFGRHQGKWIQRGKHSVTAVSGQSVSFAFPSVPPEAKGKTYDLILTVSKSNGTAPAAK